MLLSTLTQSSFVYQLSAGHLFTVYSPPFAGSECPESIYCLPAAILSVTPAAELFVALSSVVPLSYFADVRFDVIQSADVFRVSSIKAVGFRFTYYGFAVRMDPGRQASFI